MDDRFFQEKGECDEAAKKDGIWSGNISGGKCHSLLMRKILKTTGGCFSIDCYDLRPFFILGSQKCGLCQLVSCSPSWCTPSPPSTSTTVRAELIRTGRPHKSKMAKTEDFVAFVS